MASAETWRLLPFSRGPVTEQLARAEAMHRALTGPALRWWQALPEALVLGRGQPLAAVNLQACRTAGVRVFRRSTGGTAVLCGPQLLNLDVVLPAGHPLAVADVTRSYRWLGDALAAGLNALGLSVEAVAPDVARAQTASVTADSPLRLACYALPSPYEVMSGGRKLAGLAQRRNRSGALLQAGLLLIWQPERLVRLLLLARRRDLAAQLHGRAVGLDELTGSLPSDRLTATLTAAIGLAAGAKPVDAGWTPAEEAAFADALRCAAEV